MNDISSVIIITKWTFVEWIVFRFIVRHFIVGVVNVCQLFLRFGRKFYNDAWLRETGFFNCLVSFGKLFGWSCGEQVKVFGGINWMSTGTIVEQKKKSFKLFFTFIFFVRKMSTYLIMYVRISSIECTKLKRAVITVPSSSARRIFIVVVGCDSSKHNIAMALKGIQIFDGFFVVRKNKYIILYCRKKSQNFNCKIELTVVHFLHLSCHLPNHHHLISKQMWILVLL